MAKNNTVKQVRVSPGLYFNESELPVATKSLGITHLGLVGETLRGPAFQRIKPATWGEFQRYFGGTSTEKFKKTNFPKYELPYIAKSYLEQSQNLSVVRVLGLSGTNAGPAWVITVWSKGNDESPYKEEKPMVLAVLRSRADYKKAGFVKPKDEHTCEDVYEYDKLAYRAKKVEIVKSEVLSLNDDCEPKFTSGKVELDINVNNYGTFALKVTRQDDTTETYSVTLNKGDKNYIYNVIGSDPINGDSEIYVEELYDVALQQLIEKGELDTLGTERVLPMFEVARFIPKYQSVLDILTEDESLLKRRDVGKRFLFSKAESVNSNDGTPLKVHVSKDNGLTWSQVDGEVGHIYTVVAHTTSDGRREYYYGEKQKSGKGEVLGTAEVKDETVEECVFVEADNMYYINSGTEVEPITLDMNNYKEAYRFSSTPWIVSEMKGSANNVELNKLFRFHTISDGNYSSSEVKVSIESIDPAQGTFDVLVRDFNDTDASPVILERFRGVDLIPSSQNYIALKIGSYDESYEVKSKYITVEVNENDKTKVSIPAGFLGYPVRNYNGTTLVASKKLGSVTELQKPYLQYNTTVLDDVRVKKQYFGISDLIGIDTDIFTYKGVEAYNNLPESLTPCFHLDSRILEGKPKTDVPVTSPEYGMVTDNGIKQVVSVDGVKAYQWVTVSQNNVTADGIEPRIGGEEAMMGTIYEDKSLRKFTLCFYGGYDGWDYYRETRTNTDEFKFQKYRGFIDRRSGKGTNFSLLDNPDAYGLGEYGRVMNSDWAAYMHGIQLFGNPKNSEINVFATPGIDYVNNKSLVSEALEMIETQRADSIYVLTTPDKPAGAMDSEYTMYSPSDVVMNLEDSEIDSNWACTFYPWVKYYDSANAQYIYLPPTLDYVRNLALTDNNYAPWFVTAGYERGRMDGIKPRKILKTSDQDVLYAGRLNYVNVFGEEGMRLWGDKNLQVAESNAHMNRISKRRCLIRLRKLISISCIGLLFEPGDATVVKQFKSAIDTVMETFMSNRAISGYKLVIDESAESLDKLELNAQLYIKFIGSIEYINIGLIATPQGVSFDDI